jgi:hypothetical protein
MYIIITLRDIMLIYAVFACRHTKCSVFTYPNLEVAFILVVEEVLHRDVDKTKVRSRTYDSSTKQMKTGRGLPKRE